MNEKLPNPQVLKALVALTSSHRTAQRERIRFNNRLKARERIGEGETLAATSDARMFALWRDAEKRIASQIITVVDTDKSDLFAAVLSLPTIGPMHASRLLGPIDIERSRTVGSFWRYCGMGLNEHGRPDGRVRGQSTIYNTDCRYACMRISVGLMLPQSPYSHVYREARERYLETHPEWYKAHSHMAARRMAVKRFLCHLWLTWRTMAGLPVTRPHAESDHRPADYGWPNLESEYVYYDAA